MKQNKNKYVIFLCLSLLLGFSSCEMKDELLGHEEQTEQLGSLEVELFSIYNNVIMSRAEEDVTAEDDGTTTGDFDAVDKDVNQYTLVVTNTETQEVVKKGQVSDLKNGGDKISLPLPVGKYNVKAYNYDCSNISVSTRPYFEGSANFSITNGTPTDVTLSCKLSWIEVKLGDGASQIFNKNNIGTKYYFKTPVNKNSLTVSVKATPQEGNTPIDMVYTIQKPADAEGQSANLAGGDSFLINLTEAKATDSHISAIEISANLTFTTDGTTVEIPFEDIIYNGPGLTPQPPVGEPTITFTGLPATYNCASGDQTIAGLQNVVIYVSENSTGIKSLNVTISGAIESLLGMASLPSSFDICDLDDGVKNALVGLGLISEDDYAGLHAGTVKKFTFNLSGLLVLVPQVVTTGTSTFSLSVNDGVTTDGGDIIVNVN